MLHYMTYREDYPMLNVFALHARKVTCRRRGSSLGHVCCFQIRLRGAYVPRGGHFSSRPFRLASRHFPQILSDFFQVLYKHVSL